MNKSFVVIGGSVKTTGGSLTLAKGQLAVVDEKTSGNGGVAVVSNLQGYPKGDKRFSIRLGQSPLEPNRSHSDKAGQTKTFALNEVKNLRASVPNQTKQTIDEVVVGFDGFDPATSFNFKTGQKYFNLSLEIKNGAIQYRGGHNNCEVVNVYVEIPAIDYYDTCNDQDECAEIDCKAIVLETIERLKRKQVTGGHLLTEFVDITPVFECDNPAVTGDIEYTTYTLDVCDEGGDVALAMIQAQFDNRIERIDRKGSISTYQILSSDGAPDEYEQTIGSIIKGCESCPEGWEETPGGILYAIVVQDGGTDRSAAIGTALANAKLIGSVTRGSGGVDGAGFYTALYSEPITQAEISSFVAAQVYFRTATVELVGTVASICEDDTVTEISWVEGATCTATTQTYSIVLPDNECGESRLAELQSNYKDLTIAIADSPTLGSVAVTLTGSSGTANINVDGVDYLATYASSLTITANNFVTAHASTLLEEGITVTANAGVLTFAGLNSLITGITVTNATTNLAGTVAALVPDEDRRGCQTRYTTTVTTNIVCDECDPVFLDYYKSEAPSSFENTAWTLDAGQDLTPNGNCLCGIRFKGKTFYISGEEALRDIIGFTETSTQIRVAADFPNEIREGIGFIGKGTAAVKYFDRWVPRTHLAGNLREIEKEGKAHFFGEVYNGNYLGRILRQTTSNMPDNLIQQVVYYLEIGHEGSAGGFSSKHLDTVEYAFFVEVGRQTQVESILNEIASNAGVSPVVALP
jgi:hypothetical protein